jgi:hypothetical protein
MIVPAGYEYLNQQSTFGLVGLVDEVTHWAYGFDPADRYRALCGLLDVVQQLGREAHDEAMRDQFNVRPIVHRPDWLPLSLAVVAVPERGR